MYLPDPLVLWPWPRTLNPHYAEVKPGSDIWLRDFNAFDEKSQRSFDLCNFALLCGLGYPLLNKDCLGVACDLMALMFVVDEYTDKVDNDGARAYAEIVMDALRKPHSERPQGESKLGEIARQFSLKAIQVVSASSWKRFIVTFAEYLDAVIDEAADRAAGHVRGIADYLKLRRLTIGGYPSFLCFELGLDIPDEVIEHPGIKSLLSLVAETILLTNDMYSYNVEQARGYDSHNIITVVMNEKGVDLDGALNWIMVTYEQVLSKFEAQSCTLPSWGPTVDAAVNNYIERMSFWIRGHDCWSFESERYFGTKGVEIQRLRVMPLLPKVYGADLTPVASQRPSHTT
ncbi:terpenoid synthase [Russula compacta]|nr:terpenoid synthase [Russula compacta]